MICDLNIFRFCLRFSLGILFQVSSELIDRCGFSHFSQFNAPENPLGLRTSVHSIEILLSKKFGAKPDELSATDPYTSYWAVSLPRPYPNPSSKLWRPWLRPQSRGNNHPTPPQSSRIDQPFTLDELYSKKSTTPGPDYPIALSSNSQHPPSSPYVEFSMLYGQNLSFQTSGYPIKSLSFPRKTLQNSKPIALAPCIRKLVDSIPNKKLAH